MSEWHMATLADVGDIVTGSTPSTARDVYWGRDMPFVTPADISASPYVRNTERSLSRQGTLFARVVPSKSVLVTCIGSTIGKIAYATSNCCTNQQLNSVIPFEDVDARFLYYGIANMADHIKQLAGTTAVPIINKSEFSRVEINLPPLPEQRKIASILTTVDNLIEQTEALIEKYKSIKQGMMHDLFTRGVDSTGQLRPPYEDAPHLYKQSPLGWIPNEWDTLSLREVVSVNQGLQIAISERFRSPGPNRHLYITIQYLNNTHSEKDTFYIEESNSSVVCDHSDILMVRTGNTGMVVTDVAGVFHNNFFKVIYDRRRAVRDFMVTHLQRQVIQKLIMDYAGTTTIPDLNHRDFYRLPFNCPPKQEQTLIMSKLNAISSCLTYEAAYADQLRLVKTGLMQDLLTGKVRVNVDETEEVTANV
jgi:type I restriction enzyme, S subunit